ncbi:MAG: Resolvase domain [Bacillota bacterium]|nr:MAG: Resolvase domain [Bacillota bacterium]
MFGYHIVKGKVEIDPEQAAVVRMIFEDYIGGMGGSRIAKKLKEMNVATVRSGDGNGERVIAILKNEKYAGNALLQKKYVADHLTKKLVRNIGTLPMYFAEGTHPAIIDAAIFEKAQAVMEQRRRRYSTKDTSGNRYPFSGIIQCGNCGKKYKRRVNKGNPVWQCSTFLLMGKDACHTKQIPEPILHATAAEVLGLGRFGADIFRESIAEIRVPEFNKLVFVFRDGRTSEKVWQGRSRRESWTIEMRREAGARAKGRE